MKKIKNYKTGFTLIEMLAVLFIIGIIFSITLPAFGPMMRTLKLKTAAENLANVLESARQYAVTSGQYCDVVFPITGDNAYKAYRIYSIKVEGENKIIDKAIGKPEILPNGVSVYREKTDFMNKIVIVPFPENNSTQISAGYIRFKPNGSGDTGGNVCLIDPHSNIFQKITIPSSPAKVSIKEMGDEE